MNSIHLSSAVAVGLLCSSLVAQPPGPGLASFDFDDFSDTSAITFNGSAVPVPATNRIALTQSGFANQTSSAFFSNPVDISAGFEMTFEFVWSPANAEGFAFVLQNDPRGAMALGGGTFGLGYGFGQGSGGPAIANGLALEFDIERQGFLSDMGNTETTLHSQGALPLTENEFGSIARAASPVSPTASVRTIFVRYVPGMFEMFVDGDPVPRMVSDFDHRSGASLLAGGSVGGLDLPSESVYVGFTAANGTSATQTVEILNWEYNALVPPPPCALGTVTSGGAPFDSLRLNGSIGDFFRGVELGIGEPWELSIEPPPGVGARPFVLLADLGVFDGAMPFPIGTGELCLSSFSVLNLGSALAPASLSVPPQVFLDVPLSFQALISSDPMQPMQFDVTNAIALEFVDNPPPVVNSFSPAAVAPGEVITINGSGFSEFVRVFIGPVQVVPTSVTPTMIQVLAPPGLPCDAPLLVANPDGDAVLASSDVNPSPTVTQSPSLTGSSAGGSFVIIVGSGFLPGATVTIGGSPATVISSQPTGLFVTAPPGSPGSVPLVVTNPNGCFGSATFTYF